MNVVVSQPRYLPAINYIQRLYYADIFVVLDNVQRQARGWENRNKILMDGVPKWLTIPISSSSRVDIKDANIADVSWIDTHKQALFNAYKNAPCFDYGLIDLYYKNVETCFCGKGASFRDVVVMTLNNCCSIFNFVPKLKLSSEIPQRLDLIGPKKIVEICHSLGANTYISGPNGISYGIVEAFDQIPTKVVFHEFTHPNYRQFNSINRFFPYMSFFDLVFNVGVDNASSIVRGEFHLHDN